MKSLHKELTQGEVDLYYWQYNKLGGFMTKIFDAMSVADNTNLKKLSKAYPEQVAAYRRYCNENGYWNNIKDRMQ